MVSERNRIINLTAYLESLGLSVNIGKNFARGNKGFFKADGSNFRIDIAKKMSDEEIVRILTHEFAHFVHYKLDKSLKSLHFIIDESNQELWDEMINLTVESIPKDSVKPIFEQQSSLKLIIKDLVAEIKKNYPDFKANKTYKVLENKIKKSFLKYLLKYDKVKVFEGFSFKIYSIEDLDSYQSFDKDIILYIKLKASQRQLRRCNSKIARLNKYYNTPTELFARSIEFYFLDKEKMKQKAPNLFNNIDSLIKAEKISYLNDWNKLIKT